MWQDIVLHSGQEDIRSSTTASTLPLILQSDSTAAADGNELLLEATNHASALELEQSNQALTTRLELLEEDRNNLHDSLSKEISYLQSRIGSKDEEIRALKQKAEEQQETKQREESLRQQLEDSKSSWNELNEDNIKNLKERDSRIAALVDKVRGLEERIR